LLDRGAAEIVLNQSDKALADFDKAAQVSPKSHLPFVYCGQFYSAHRRYDKAVAEFSRAVDLKTDDVGSLRGRGHAYAELGRWERATADFSATARLNPGDALDQYWLVYALLGSKKRSEARVACDAMLKRFRTTKKPVAACLVTLGGVLVSGVAKDAEPYLQIIEKAAAANPKDYGFACAWGAALYRCGRFEKAGGELTGAGALNSRNDAPFDLLLLAMVHAKSGHPTKARRCLDNAVRWIEQRAGGGAETSDRLPPWQTRLQLELLRHEAETLLTPLEKGDGAERHAPRN
jgi:tetratricopeptide (TPR) repeat protein